VNTVTLDMSNLLMDSAPLQEYDNQQNGDKILYADQTNEDDSWENLLMGSGEEKAKEAMSLDLNTLLRVLDEHNNAKDDEGNSYSTWQLVIIQGLLLTILVIVSITWACCCRRRCFNAAPPRVQDALRKLSLQSTKSKDFPPSYSTADLHTLAMSVHDYLYPPPQYPEINRRSCDDLAYLDLEAGHQRLSRLSFSGTSSPLQHSSSGGGSSPLIPALPAPLSWQPSSLSLSSESSKSSAESSSSSSSSRKNSIMKDTHSRKSSLESRRSSRVSFSEAVEVSNGSYRRLSGSQDYLARLAEIHDPLFSRQSSTSSLSSEGSRRSSSSDGSRRSSSSSDLSRRSSSNDLVRKGSASLLLSRKLGLSQEALDKELRKKLENLEREEQAILEEEERRQQQAELERIEAEMKRNEIEVISSSPATPLETIVEIEKH